MRAFILERIGSGAIEATKMGMQYYGNGEWGKNGKVTHVQTGLDKLEKVQPKPAKLTVQPKSEFVNKQVNKTQWKSLGQGAQSSVWGNKSQPGQVVKISGGGRQMYADDQETDLAYIHFLIDHGKHFPHLPIIFDVDTTDPHVIQIKMEPLKKPAAKLADKLQEFATAIDSRWPDEEIDDIRGDLEDLIDKYKLAGKNDVADIETTIRLLKSKQYEYRQKYTRKRVYKNDGLDLHSGNWMLAADGRIIAADPWFGGQ